MSWKKIAVTVGIIVVVATITLYVNGNWKDIVNEALKSVQVYIGIKSGYFQIP